MFKNVKRKLKSRTGASLLMSLVFFLTTMMVGAVCLTASYVNAGRASHELKEQQAYFAVDSAVNLITSDMQKAKFETVTDSAGVTALKNTDASGNTGKLLDKISVEGEFLDGTIKKTANLIHSDQEKNLTIKAASTPASTEDTVKTMTDVHVKVAIGKKAALKEELIDIEASDPEDFTVTILLYTGDESASKYRTKLTFEAIPRVEQVYDGDNDTVEEKHVVVWSDPQVSKKPVGSLGGSKPNEKTEP